jgi:hypothetical protein
MAVLGSWWLRHMLRRAVARGERFVARPGRSRLEPHGPAAPALAAIPLFVVLAIAFLLHERYQTSALVLALLGGSIATALVNLRYLRSAGAALSAGSIGALLAVGNTAAVVGFGAVASALPAFRDIVQWVVAMPGSGPRERGDRRERDRRHDRLRVRRDRPSRCRSSRRTSSRAASIPSSSTASWRCRPGALDALPHNGYVVTTIRRHLRRDAPGRVLAAGRARRGGADAGTGSCASCCSRWACSYAVSASAIAAFSAASCGSVVGAKRARTSPSRPTRNFSKFHWMSPG